MNVDDSMTTSGLPARTIDRKPVLMRAYIVGMFAAIIMLPIGGVVTAIVAWLTVTWGIWLVYRADTYTQDKLWGKAVVTLFFPTALWILFGIGGVICLLFPDLVVEYITQVEPLYILLFTIYALLGSIVYIFVVNLVVGSSNYKPDLDVIGSLFRVQFLTYSIVAFDWYVRLDQIRNGVYFTWLRDFSEMERLVRGTNILYQMQNGLGNLIIPLCLYLEAKTSRRFFRFLAFAQIILVFLQGSRSNILLALFVFIVADSIVQKKRIDYRLWVQIFGVVILILAVVGPPFQVARLQMRVDARSLQQDPILIPIRFVTQYLPASFRIDSYLQTEERASVVGRIGSYMSYGASIQQALTDGRGRLAAEQFDEAVLGVVPRFLYPNKPVLDADAVVQMRFRFDLNNVDAAGTPIADVFAHLHLIGILFLSVAVAVTYGLIVRWMIFYGMLGELVVLGLAPIFLPVGDAFGSYLALLRNAILIVLLIRVVISGVPIEVSK